MQIKLKFSENALKTLAEFERGLEIRMAPSKDLHGMLDWAAKLKGQVVRIAGALHSASHLTELGFKTFEIDDQTIKDAIDIAKYFIPHSKHVFEILGEPKITQDSRAVIQWIKDNRFTSFKFNECHTKFKGRLHTSKDVDRVLGNLIDRNFIRPIKQMNATGRPPKAYQVNPALYS